MGAVVLDSNIIVGLFNPHDALHDSVRHALSEHAAEGDAFVLPASVLAEVLVGTARSGAAAVEQRRDELRALCGSVRVTDEAVAVEAARLRARHASLRLPDALVVATGIVDAAAVLTADKRLAKVHDRIRLLSQS